MSDYQFQLMAWYKATTDAYEKTMTDSQKDELHAWEAENLNDSKTFSSDWPGWVALIGSKPSREASSAADSSGFVYLIRCGDTRLYKIGKARNVASRLAALQIANPLPLNLIDSYEVSDASIEESELHLQFKDKNERGEWFALTDADLLWFRDRARTHVPLVKLADQLEHWQREGRER
jgi:Meiotically up-regulated gene 113